MPKIKYHKVVPDPSLDDYCNKRKKILILRNAGGLGDIFMHRMIFEDFKLLLPDCHITFACPPEYFEAVSDHPYIDELIDWKKVNINDYGVHYDTSFICNKYELEHAPNCDKHRCDIWAEHCGVELQRHNMHFILSDEEKEWARSFIKEINPKGQKTVLIAPISAMDNKNMTPEQIIPVVDVLSKEYCVFGLHDFPLNLYNLSSMIGANQRHFISLIDASDYVITVDTAAFHCAGGLGKPTVAIFGWADGLVYSKYYKNVSLVQKHKNYTPDWTCGPCYNFTTCCKVPNQMISKKPCITEITPEMILDGFEKLKNR
jgi:ADP-heptose:LPS heptosyltransferase